MRKLLGILTLVGIAGAAQAASLTGDQLRAELVGKPISFKSIDGKISGTTTYSADGKASLSGSTTPNIQSDQGTSNKLTLTY